MFVLKIYYVVHKSYNKINILYLQNVILFLEILELILKECSTERK